MKRRSHWSAIISAMFLVVAGFSLFFYLHRPNHSSAVQTQTQQPPPVLAEIDKRIPAGYSFYDLLNELPGSIGSTTKQSIMASLANVYDTSKLTAGNLLSFFVDQTTNQLKRIVYTVNADQNLQIESTSSDQWRAQIVDIPYETKIETVQGTVDSSVYQTFIDLNKDPKLAILLSEIFAWQVDFAFHVQKGDSFAVTYEARYLNGTYQMPGKILAAKFVNSGQSFYAYYFKSDKTPAGYYDENGLSLKRMFLKFPLQYKYVSTYFTYRRVDPVNGAIEPHRAVDFAAAAGTPVVAIGDGVITDAGWRGEYGNKVVIHHDKGYTTTYGHFSRFGKGIKIGAHVTQGQIIGYVGSTGLSTGPHLHYEVRKSGTLVNPLAIVPPPGKPINTTDETAFSETKSLFSLV